MSLMGNKRYQLQDDLQKKYFVRTSVRMTEGQLCEALQIQLFTFTGAYTGFLTGVGLTFSFFQNSVGGLKGNNDQSRHNLAVIPISPCSLFFCSSFCVLERKATYLLVQAFGLVLMYFISRTHETSNIFHLEYFNHATSSQDISAARFANITHCF